MKRLYPFIMGTSLLLTVLFHPMVAHADMFGGDVAVLLQILQNALQELVVLQQTLDVAKGDSELLRQVNRDIETALTQIDAIEDVVRDTNEIGKIKDPAELLNKLRNIYGNLPRLGNTKAFEFADTASSNGLAVDNDTYMHASKLDKVALGLQAEARSASPGRAQQITAQSQSAIIHSLAQIERTSATQLRISSTQLAIKNNENKSHAESFESSYSAMTESKASTPTDLTLRSL